MKNKKLSPFLIVSLSLTAFLGGYLFLKGDLGLINSPSSKTGTILDKFGSDSASSDKNSPTPNATPDETTPFLVSDRKVVSPTTSPDNGSVLYYEKNTGKLFEYDLVNKSETSVSSQILTNFVSALWSPNKKEVINAFYSEKGFDFKYSNLDTGKTILLGPGVQSMAFSPDGNYLAYFSTDPTSSGSAEGSVFVAQSDGSTPKKVLGTRISGLQILWPSLNQIVLETPDKGILLLDPDKVWLKNFMDPKVNVQENWSKSGNKELFSTQVDPNSSLPDLYLKSADSGDEKPLNIQADALKCAWSIDDINFYCAIPSSPSADDVYKINSSDGSKKLVYQLDFAVKTLFLSNTEDYILFINNSDEKLYALRLGK